jgi:hypothetical protein
MKSIIQVYQQFRKNQRDPERIEYTGKDRIIGTALMG